MSVVVVLGLVGGSFTTALRADADGAGSGAVNIVEGSVSAEEAQSSLEFIARLPAQERGVLLGTTGRFSNGPVSQDLADVAVGEAARRSSTTFDTSYVLRFGTALIVAGVTEGLDGLTATVHILDPVGSDPTVWTGLAQTQAVANTAHDWLILTTNGGSPIVRPLPSFGSEDEITIQERAILRMIYAISSLSLSTRRSWEVVILFPQPSFSNATSRLPCF